MAHSDFWYGAVLLVNSKDTLESIELNLKQMKENGFNTVVVWPAAFWWEEKKEGYPFNTGRALLEMAGKIGLKIIMELAGQVHFVDYMPDSEIKDEYYQVDADGHLVGGLEARGLVNEMHPEVDAKVRELFAKEADAYRDYPALLGYDIYNETSFHSIDKYTMEHYRVWLQKKYQTIENLNYVWESGYTDFSQIVYSPHTWLGIMSEVDFQLFFRTLIPEFLQGWREAILAVDDKHVITADNVGSMIAPSQVIQGRDDFALKKVADEIGTSFYPKWGHESDLPYERWACLDGFYAASGREGFYVAEMQTHNQSLYKPMSAVSPSELTFWCNEALAAGINGLIYWKWRPFNTGIQTLGRGLVDYKNRSTPRLEAAKEFAQTIQETGVLKPIRSKIAIVYDDACEIFQQTLSRTWNDDPNAKPLYLGALQGAYSAMMDAGIRCDFTKLDDIQSYPMIILSNLLVINDEIAQTLKNYVDAGGIIVCDGKIGIIDSTALLNKQLPGGAFNDYMGHEFMDTDCKHMDFTCGADAYQGFYSRELVELTDGECLGKFEDGAPAVVVKHTGKGKVITLNTQMWYGYHQQGGSAKEFAAMLADTHGLRDLEFDEPLKGRITENETHYVAFLFNYTDQPVKTHLKGYGFDEDVTVEGNGFVRISRRKA